MLVLNCLRACGPTWVGAAIILVGLLVTFVSSVRSAEVQSDAAPGYGLESRISWTIKTDEIERLTASRLSLMPELLLRDMTAMQVADLTEFLASLK